MKVPKKIIIFDESKNNSDILRKCLTNLMYFENQLFYFESKNQAWDCIRRQFYLNCDIEMIIIIETSVDGCGTELVLRIRKLDPKKKIPIILITPGISKFYLTKLIKFGIDHLLLLPINLETLSQKIPKHKLD